MKKILSLILLLVLLVACNAKEKKSNVSEETKVEQPKVIINDSIMGLKLGDSISNCKDMLSIWHHDYDDFYSRKNLTFAGVLWDMASAWFYDGKLEKISLISRSYEKAGTIDEYRLETNIRNMELLQGELDAKYKSIKKIEYDGFDQNTTAPSDSYFFKNCVIFMFMTEGCLDESVIHEYSDGTNLVSLSYHQYGMLNLEYVNLELFNKHLDSRTPKGNSDDL